MKNNILLLFGYCICISSFSQNPVEPCCNVISKDIKNNLLVARDGITGRLVCFRTDSFDLKAIAIGDPVSIDILSNKITAIRGSMRSYRIIEPDKREPVDILSGFQIDHAEPVNGLLYTSMNKAMPVNSNIVVYRSKALGAEAVNSAMNKISYGEPCCSVVDVQPDPSEPCCNVVSFKNSITGGIAQFKAPREISNTLKIGQPVYSEPINTVRLSNAEGLKNIQVDGSEPCCSVVSVQPDPGEPCCNVVVYKNNASGASYRFRANKNLSTIKVGQPLYAEPVDGFAIVQSSYNAPAGQLNSYGYGATSADNGTNTSNDKWVITSLAGMKGVLGKLNLIFPEDVDWSVDIRTAENKFITNRSKASHHTSTDIAPGIYTFKLNTIDVESVPIEKGKETRLKAGYLNIVSEGDWNLYDDSKQKFHTSGNKPKKIALPVGNYQLRLGGQFFPVVIKDKETVAL